MKRNHASRGAMTSKESPHRERTLCNQSTTRITGCPGHWSISIWLNGKFSPSLFTSLNHDHWHNAQRLLDKITQWLRILFETLHMLWLLSCESQLLMSCIRAHGRCRYFNCGKKLCPLGYTSPDVVHQINRHPADACGKFDSNDTRTNYLVRSRWLSSQKARAFFDSCTMANSACLLTQLPLLETALEIMIQQTYLPLLSTLPADSRCRSPSPLLSPAL